MKTKTIEVTKYISDDGKEFDTGEECLNYENSLKVKKMETGLKVLDEIIYKVNNKEEYDFLRNHIGDYLNLREVEKPYDKEDGGDFYFSQVYGELSGSSYFKMHSVKYHFLTTKKHLLKELEIIQNLEKEIKKLE